MRLISRIDVKNDFVIKGIHLEGLRKVGKPNQLAKKYYEDGIDEILFMDAVASLYKRNNLFEIIERAAREVFVPITLGGGLRSLGDIDNALRAGADKVAINTAAINNPTLISEASARFGSQCIVSSIEAKINPLMPSGWEVYVDNGREKTEKDVCEWVKQLQDLGSGEILLTSIDQEGTKRGFDIPLFERVNAFTTIPVVVSGGAGTLKHFTDVVATNQPSGLAIASMLHYNMHSIPEIKSYLSSHSVEVRQL